MLVYYNNTDPDEHARDVEMSWAQTRDIFRRLSPPVGHDNSFLGVQLSEDVALQFLYLMPLYWLEIVDSPQYAALSCNVNEDIALSALEAAFRGEGISGVVDAVNRHPLSHLVTWETYPLDGEELEALFREDEE